MVETYGQVIIDECHHVGAVSFDAILKRVKARYVLGLTATPIRRDGQQPIIFMQCGPIRHSATRPSSAPQDLEVLPRYRERRIYADKDVGIQEIFKMLATDDTRTEAIASEIEAAILAGTKVLVLTERTEHLAARELRWWRRLMPCQAMHPGFCYPLANWWGRALITRHWIRWFSRCPFHGRAPFSNMRVAFTATMLKKPA